MRHVRFLRGLMCVPVIGTHTHQRYQDYYLDTIGSLWTTDLQPASLSAFFLRVPQAEPCRRPDNGSYLRSTGVLAQVHIWVPPTLLDTTLQAFEATLQGGGDCWGGIFPILPLPSRSRGKDCSSLSASPPLRVWGGGGQLPSSNPGCGCAGEGQDGGDGHPKLGPDEGYAVFPESLWGEGALQRLSPTA